MLKIILHAFVEANKETAVVEVAFASQDKDMISAKMTELEKQFPQDYLAVYDLTLDTDLTQLPHYPSVAIGKEEFEWQVGRVKKW